jgi:putative ABC transport system permease protein
MLRLTVKNLWERKVRLALTGVAVVLGVAFMVGTMVLTDTISYTFDSMFESANEGIDVVVQQPEGIQSDMGAVRDRVPAELVDQVRSVDGVTTAAGSIQGFAQLVNADGSASSLDGVGTTVGMNWIDDETLNPFTLSSGHAPESATEMVLDEATAESQGWNLGDPVTVLAKGSPTEMTLVGTATFGEIGGLPGASAVGVTDETAQTLFAEPGTYDLIAVTAEDGVDQDELRGRVDSTLGAGTYEVVTGESDTTDKKSDFQEDLSFFNTFLLAFAFVSLFVGTFIIYNTFSILVAQRTKDMAMLRAIGASRRQLLRSIVGESALVGVVAGVVGLGLGVVMSFALKAMLGAVGVDIPAGKTIVAANTVVTALIVGVVVTVLSAVGPALRGSRVLPIAALRDVAIDRSATSVARVVVGVLITALGVVGFAAGVVGSGPSALQLLAMGAIAVFLGVFVLGPVIARPVVRALGAPLPRLFGTTGRLSRENATRSPKRTAATASALMVGVALVGFTTILASSTKASIHDAVDQSMNAEYVVDSGAWGEGGFSPDLAASLESIPEVESVSGQRSAPVEIEGEASNVDAVNTSTINGLYDLKVAEGSLEALDTTSIAVKSNVAEERSLEIGDTVTVGFATGPVDLEVGALFDEYLPNGGNNYLVDLDTFEQHVIDQFDKKVYVGTADGVTAAQSSEAVEAVLADQPNAELVDRAHFKEDVTAEIDSMLNLIYGLLGLAVIIALIGIANTLALSIHERRREIGLLRAVGMTRSQVRTTVRGESLLVALLGTALGTVLAIGAAWGIVQALATQGVTTFVIPPVPMVAIAVMAAIAGIAAAVLPARRAANLDVLDALQMQ